MRVVYLDWELDKEVLVSETRLLKTGAMLAMNVLHSDLFQISTHFSVVNLFSL